MNPTKPNQLWLQLEKNALLRFDDFIPIENALAFETLHHWPQHSKMIYLEGPRGSGKTHLAEAVAEQALAQDKQVILLSGASLPAPHFFYELPPLDFFILDDADQLLQFSSRYEEALFALYNQIFDRPQAHLLLTANTAIDQLPLKLKDLRSRLKGMLHFMLKHDTISEN